MYTHTWQKEASGGYFFWGGGGGGGGGEGGGTFSYLDGVPCMKLH